MTSILLIDDVAGVRLAVKAALSTKGYEITEADNGTAGLKLFAEKNFDLVITDIMMPEQDGTEVIMSMINQEDRPPILAISGGGGSVPAEIALTVAKKRADAILTKPFTTAELVNAVDNLLSQAA